MKSMNQIVNISRHNYFFFIFLLFFSVPSSSAQTQQSGPQSLNESSSSENLTNNAQTQIEEAAEHFDSFALLMPQVLNSKLQSFLKHGFKVFLLEDPQTKPAEEQMIDSLIKGLQALGNSLSEDLANNPIHQDVKPIPKKPNPKQ